MKKWLQTRGYAKPLIQRLGVFGNRVQNRLMELNRHPTNGPSDKPIAALHSRAGSNSLSAGPDRRTFVIGLCAAALAPIPEVSASELSSPFIRLIAALDIAFSSFCSSEAKFNAMSVSDETADAQMDANPSSDPADHMAFLAYMQAVDEACAAAEAVFTTTAQTEADEDAILHALDLYRDHLRPSLFASEAARELFLPLRHQGTAAVAYQHLRNELLTGPDDMLEKCQVPWFMHEIRAQHAALVAR